MKMAISLSNGIFKYLRASRNKQKATDVFELRYKGTINPDQNRWELCSRVLSQRDVEEKLSKPW